MNHKSLYGFLVHSIESDQAPSSLRLQPQFHVPLAHLQAQFQEIPQQYRLRHRFCSETQRFFMHRTLNSESMMSGGEFYADSEAALLDLIMRIWGENPPFRRMETQLYPGEREATEQLLKSLRGF